MADEPIPQDFQAAAIEVTTPLPEPTRPEGVDYSRTGPGADMVSMQQWANDYNDAVQAHAQTQAPAPEQQALVEAADALAPQAGADLTQQIQQQKQQGPEI